MVIVAIAVLISGGLFWWANTYYQAPADRPDVVTGYAKRLPELSDASLAKLPKGFPQEYVLGIGAEVVRGATDTMKSGGAVSRTVDVLTDMAPRAIFAEYAAFLTNDGWRVTSQNVSDNVGAIAGEKNGKTLLVTFEARSRSTLYHVDYVTSVQ